MLKKLGVLFLAAIMIIMSGVVLDTNEAEAAISYKLALKKNVAYKYDLDGDKDKDTIKIYCSDDDLKLKVNKSVKTLYEDVEDCKYTVNIYDFNKNDKSAEIVFSWVDGNKWGIQILKYKNSKCVLNKTYKYAKFYRYDPNTGMVTLLEFDKGRFNKFYKAMGCFTCYGKVKINGYTATNQSYANTNNYIRDNAYIAAKSLTAYKTSTSSKKAFKIKDNEMIYVYGLYQKGDNRRIKVRNKYGKYGYIKIGTSLVFEKNSCVWWK